ncbi:MAG: response regulator transcription factor [Phycisphaerales bacterium JB040]
MSGIPTVFLVDDDDAVIKSIGRLLRAGGLSVEAFVSSVEFLAQHDPSRPGCLLLDFSMPGLDGLEVQRRLAESGCDRPIVFLTGQGDVPVAVEALKGGAMDFLTKPVDGEALLGAVRAGLARDRRSRDASDALREHRARLVSLTPREREVMQLVVRGLLNKQIAFQLGTAEKTVKVHRGRVMQKMGAESLADLVRIAVSLGLVEPR